MARSTQIVLSLVLILSLFNGAGVGTAHGFTLLSGDEKAGFAQQGTGGDNQPRLSPQEQSYTVEPVFSLEFPKVIVRDVVHAATSPFRWDRKDWLIFGVGLGAVAAASFADTHVRNQIRHIQNASAYDAAKQIRQFGGIYSIGVLGLFLAGGELFDKPTARAVFIDGASASLVTLGITTGLKYLVGRARPNADEGNAYYQPFSNKGGSFPSGETAQAFAVASVIASHYDEPWIKVASYGFASLVGMARMYQDAHWLSGATAGALIGTAVGISLVRFNDKRRSNPEKKTSFLITPLIDRNMTGVGITLIY